MWGLLEPASSKNHEPFQPSCSSTSRRCRNVNKSTQNLHEQKSPECMTRFNHSAIVLAVFSLWGIYER